MDVKMQIPYLLPRTFFDPNRRIRKLHNVDSNFIRT